MPLASLREGQSVHWSVGPQIRRSVVPCFFFRIVEFCVFEWFQVSDMALDYASGPRQWHLLVVYPALFLQDSLRVKWVALNRFVSPFRRVALRPCFYKTVLGWNELLWINWLIDWLIVPIPQGRMEAWAIHSDIESEFHRMRRKLRRSVRGSKRDRQDQVWLTVGVKKINMTRYGWQLE